MAQGVGDDDAADGPGAVRGINYFFIRIQNEIRGVDEPPPSIPKGAYLVRISRHFKPTGHGKRKLQFVDGLLGLVQGVYGKSYDIHILPFEFLNMGLEIGQLPIAVRSPAAAIEDQN